MAQEYPNAWTYLLAFEALLRRREAKVDKKTGDFELDAKGEPAHAPFNDDEWYRFGRHQNLDKQETAKLIVPRLVPHLLCAVDDTGGVYLDNVDVGGVQAADGVDPFLLAGLMNSTVLRFVFRRISKPFRGEYLSANRQFITPLPIPDASARAKADVAAKARALQEAHTRRRDLLSLIAARLTALRPRSNPATWLFPTVRPKADWEKNAPAGLDAAERATFADQRFAAAVAAAEDAVGERLRPGVTLDAAFTDGELIFTVDGVAVVSGLFLDDAAGAFVLAQWRVLAVSFPVTEKTKGKNLCDALRKIAQADASDAANQVMQRQAELTALDASIRAQEAAINGVINDLYELTFAERALIQRG